MDIFEGEFDNEQFSTTQHIAVDNTHILQVYDAFVNEGQTETRKDKYYLALDLETNLFQENESKDNLLKMSKSDEASLHEVSELQDISMHVLERSLDNEQSNQMDTTQHVEDDNNYIRRVFDSFVHEDQAQVTTNADQDA